ncbi:MAG: hypothetical protein KDH19_11495 [Geminicoccaceae bacterium]|nr:hypothetical protein [Geminicoccaceae bacterium]
MSASPFGSTPYFRKLSDGFGHHLVLRMHRNGLLLVEHGEEIAGSFEAVGWSKLDRHDAAELARCLLDFLALPEGDGE